MAEERMMKSLRTLSVLLVVLGACALVGAQETDPKDPGKAKPDDKAKAEKKEPKVKVGDRFPVLKVDSILHPKLKALTELRGRLVLYEYFQHW
jgi:hypothetical protein